MSAQYLPSQLTATVKLDMIPHCCKPQESQSMGKQTGYYPYNGKQTLRYKAGSTSSNQVVIEAMVWRILTIRNGRVSIGDS